MAIYKQIFPTSWPIFEFQLSIWKLTIGTALFSPSIESRSYTYIVLVGMWGQKGLFRIRLYDTEQRVNSRLDGILNQPEAITKKQLEQIIIQAQKELGKIIINEKKS